MAAQPKRCPFCGTVSSGSAKCPQCGTELDVEGPRWEYLMVPVGSLGNNQQQEMNRLGRDGWELTGALEGMPIFKRRLKTQ